MTTGMLERGGVHRVVVGVDGSPGSVEAARFAANEAAVRGLDLLVVHAATPASADARTLVDEALSDVRVAPTTLVHTVVEAALPEALLTALTDDAALVVLGQHHVALVDGGLDGRLAPAVGAHARCPMVVVPAGWSRTAAGRAHLRPQPIIVGLGEPSSATSVLKVAYEEAERRQASLLVLHASTSVDLARSQRAANARTVAEVVAGQQQGHPDVAIDYLFVTGGTIQALVDASSRASLMILGRPRRPRGRRSWHYSMARSMLHLARCPLVVVAAEARSAAATRRSQRGARVLVR